MNGIRLILYTATLITSHTVFGMQYQLNHKSNISKIEAQYTSLALNYLDEKDQEHFFENIHTIRNKNLGKSDPTIDLLMEKAKKMRDEEIKHNSREKRKTI
jgi:hypothetical protein